MKVPLIGPHHPLHPKPGTHTRFWKAFRLRPGAPIVLFNIARTMEELHDPRTEDFYAAAATQVNIDASYQLAMLCSAAGRIGEAVEHLKAYFKGNPPNDSCTKWARNANRQLCPPCWCGAREEG